VRNGRLRSFKVVDLGISRKRVCNFALVINYSNLGLILPHFRGIAGFLLSDPTPVQHFGGVPL